MDIKFYGLGEILIDFLPVTNREKEPIYKEVAGGAPANVTASLARLGAKSYFIGKVGEDIFGKHLLQAAKDVGIDIEYMTTTKEGQTALAFVALDSEGERTFSFYRNNCADMQMDVSDIPIEKLNEKSILHFGSISTIGDRSRKATEHAIEIARKQGTLVSYDPNLRPALWDNQEEMITRVRFYLSKADIIKLSIEEVEALYGTYDKKVFEQLLETVKLIIVTEGAQGATAYTKKHQVFMPGFSVNVIDTTGAGDTFIAGALYKIMEALKNEKTLESILENEEWLKEMLIFANANAALTTTKKGVFTAVSSLLEVNTFIAQQGGNKEILEYANKVVLENAKRCKESIYRLNYHIMASSGWINDPNGLIHFKDKYHVFFQHHPFSPEWGPMYWGHVTSKDLVHWKHEPIAIAPDQPYESGCFSGSAVDVDGIMTLFYTAHNLENSPKEKQCMVRSYDDGKTFEKFNQNPIIKEYPRECSEDFRDPKVWKYDDLWYMIVGSGKNKRGKIPLYTSSDLENWEYKGIMCEAEQGQGVMWECPNYCDLGEKQVLIVSPMEMKGHKNIFIIGKFDYETLKFTQECYVDIDFGDDFYAAQIFEDQQGRTILIGWMDMWGSEMPCQEDGWAGALTIPRVLTYKEDRVIQTPVEELKGLRTETVIVKTMEISDRNSHTLREKPLGKALEIKGTINMANSKKFIIELCCSKDGKEKTQLIFDRIKGKIVLDKTLSGKGQKKKNKIDYSFDTNQVPVHIFIDQSSVEVFIDNGKKVISNRIYPGKESNYLDMYADNGSITFYDLEIYKLENIWE